jgi:hypothetical protein
MRNVLLVIPALAVSLPLAAQPLRIVNLDRNGHLLATNTTVDQRYSLGWAASVDGLAPSNMITLQSRVAHSASTTFRPILEHPAMFFRIFLDPFATSDLAGHWTSQMLTVADDPGDFAGWGRFQISINAMGTATTTAAERSNGDSNIYNPILSMTVASDGTVGGFFTNSPALVLDKDTLVGVMNDGGGGCNLFTMVKRAASGFSTADLQGQWTLLGVAFGIPPATWGGGWIRHELAFDAQGKGIFTAALRSNGDTRLPPAFTEYLLPDGSGASSAGPPGVMALNKNVTWSVGNDPGDDGRGFYVIVRRAASGFSTADAEGKWTMFTLSTRDGPPGSVGWGRHELIINAQGQASFTAAERSNGDSSLPESFTLTVGADGTATGLTPPVVMTLDKNVICGVRTESHGSYTLSIMVRR